MAIDWSYADPAHPSPDELLRELNGKALADVRDAEGKVIRKAGEHAQLVRRDARRRLDRRLDVDLHRRLRAQRQPLAAAEQRGPLGARRLRRVGLRLAGQPPNPVQPGFGRSPGQALERAEEVHVLGRLALDRSGRAGLRPDDPARPGDRPLHHERGGRIAPVGPRPDGGRPVPGALRAVRVAGGQPAVPQGPGQPGGAGVRRRHGDLRRPPRSSRSSPPPIG